MIRSKWDQRIRRADELAAEHPFAAEVLRFYSHVARFQKDLYAGMAGVGRGMRQAALALGLAPRDQLLLIELPLAAPAILAGIKTSAVIGVGTATIAAFIGAGGYGERIAQGLALNDNTTLLAGAIPAAALALIIQGAFELIERYALPALRVRV